MKRFFSVKVKAVNTIVRKGKVKRFKGIVGRQSDVKKSDRDTGCWSVYRRFDRSLERLGDRNNGISNLIQQHLGSVSLSLWNVLVFIRENL